MFVALAVVFGAAEAAVGLGGGAAFGVFDEDIEIAVLVEDSCVDQLKLEISLAPFSIFLDQSRIGKFGVRIFVKKLHVRMGWCRIEIEIVLLDVFAVIAFVAR